MDYKKLLISLLLIPALAFGADASNRLNMTIEGVLFGCIFAGLYWLLGAIIYFIAGIEIRREIGYVIAVALGFATRRVIIQVLSS